MIRKTFLLYRRRLDSLIMKAQFRGGGDHSKIYDFKGGRSKNMVCKGAGGNQARLSVLTASIMAQKNSSRIPDIAFLRF